MSTPTTHVEARSADIAVEEWLQELERLQADSQTRPAAAFTSRELAALSGRGIDWIRTFSARKRTGTLL